MVMPIEVFRTYVRYMYLSGRVVTSYILPWMIRLTGMRIFHSVPLEFENPPLGSHRSLGAYK